MRCTIPLLSAYRYVVVDDDDSKIPRPDDEDPVDVKCSPDAHRKMVRHTKTALFVLAAILYLCLATAASEDAHDTPSSSDKDATIDPDIKDILGGDDGESPSSSSSSSSHAGEPVPPSVEEKEKQEPDLMDHGDEEEAAVKDKAAAEEKSKKEGASNSTAVTDSAEAVFLPEEGAAEKEHSSSLTIFFVLSIIVLCIFLVHFILRSKCHYLPESLVIVFLGAVIGLFMRMLPTEDMKSVESFSPTMFFLVLLPPIIFESGYNLHKGNFFTNLGSILLFAIVGTTISALVVGGGVYLLGMADIVYKLNFVQSFAFGSLISAVDPVATLAIFQALDVDPVLNMLVRRHHRSMGGTSSLNAF